MSELERDASGTKKKEWGKFYLKKFIKKKLSTNKWCKKLYKRIIQNCFIQINATLYQRNDAVNMYFSKIVILG